MTHSLPDTLAEIFRAYGRASDALGLFVDLAQNWIRSTIELNASIRRKIDAAQGVETAVPAPRPDLVRNDDSIRLELTEGEFRSLRHIFTIASDLFTSSPDILLNMAFIYQMALYDALVTDALSAVLIARPEMLKSKKQLTHEQIIDVGTTDQLIRLMAERELADFAYASCRDQVRYIHDRFGIDLAESGVDTEQLAEMMARRNILVHNNGIVNERYLRAVSRAPYKAGDRVGVSDDYWRASTGALAKPTNALHDGLQRQFIAPDLRRSDA